MDGQLALPDGTACCSLRCCVVFIMIQGYKAQKPTPSPRSSRPISSSSEPDQLVLVELDSGEHASIYDNATTGSHSTDSHSTDSHSTGSHSTGFQFNVNRALPVPAPRGRFSSVSSQNGLNDVLQATQSSYTQILQTLRCKGVHNGHYAVVQIRVPRQHEVLILIMSLGFPDEPYKPVLKGSDSKYFIHRDKRFSTVNQLLYHYKDNPTKDGVRLSRPIRKDDL